MKNSIQLQADSYYLLRRPLLPVNELIDLNTALKQDPAALWNYIKRKFADPILKEAIYLASRELHQEFEKTINNKEEAGTKIVLTIYKYLIRMSTRCTPYGLFAGCSTGKLAETTDINVDNAKLRKESRLDMNFVCELASKISGDPGVKEELTYFPNNSLYIIGDAYRYIEYKTVDHKRTYGVSSIKKCPYLEFIIDKTISGLNYCDIISSVCMYDDTLEEEEVTGFIDKLIENQVLISELEPRVTGDIYFKSLAEKIAGKADTEMCSMIGELDYYMAHPGIENYKKTVSLIGDYFDTTSSKDLIQTDLFFEHEKNTLNRTAIETITSQLSSLYRLSSKSNIQDLEKFKTSFQQIFDNQEIPLLFALDTDSGLGYATHQGDDDLLPLLDGIIPTTVKSSKIAPEGLMTKLAYDMYQRALGCKNGIAELTDEDLLQLDEPTDLGTHIPSSLFAIGSLLSADKESVDKGQFSFALTACKGPSSATLLGRFCHGDADLLQHVKQSLAEQEADQSNIIYAEIVHLPDPRAGNILMRPRLRNYEIPLLCNSSAPADHQISLQDLMVSVRDGKIILRSKSLNKIVIPRLSASHNYTTGLPVYRFLCDLQHENIYAGFSWNWGMLNDVVALPRVIYKNIILTRAKWRINLADIKQTGAALNPGNMDALCSYLEKLKVPPQVSITENDNELMLDITTQTGREMLATHIQKKGHVLLTEFLATPDNCFITGNGNDKYTNEIVLPLSNPHFQKQHNHKPLVMPQNIKRTFVPGDEWLYIKLYSSTKSADKILTELVMPLINDFINREEVAEWFFIRYNDPNHHLRIRLRIPAGKMGCIAAILTRFQATMDRAINDHIIYKIQLDTYEREIERYNENMEDSEKLFFHDSNAIINILDKLEGEDGETYRWLLATRSLDTLLNDFGLTLLAKKELMTMLSDAFFREFNGDKNLLLQLNQKYRKETIQIRSILNPLDDEKNEIKEVADLFTARTLQNQVVIERILAKNGGEMTASAKGISLLSSYLHMSINRFFPAKQRLHELTLYYFLSKYYTSCAAIQKADPAKTSKSIMVGE